MTNQPPFLQVHDHTKIMEFILLNREKIRNASTDKKLDASGILQISSKLVKDDKEMTQLFSRALVDVREIKQSVAEISDADWRPVVPVVSKLLLARSLDELESILQAEAKKRDDSDVLKIGLKVAIDVLHDGANTIYNPEFVIVQQIMDPRQIMGELSNLGNHIHDLVLGAAKADAVGAVIGGIAGYATGGVKGAGKGAVEGAINDSAHAAAS